MSSLLRPLGTRCKHGGRSAHRWHLRDLHGFCRIRAELTLGMKRAYQDEGSNLCRSECGADQWRDLSVPGDMSQAFAGRWMAQKSCVFTHIIIPSWFDLDAVRRVAAFSFRVKRYKCVWPKLEWKSVFVQGLPWHLARLLPAVGNQAGQLFCLGWQLGAWGRLCLSPLDRSGEVWAACFWDLIDMSVDSWLMGHIAFFSWTWCDKTCVKQVLPPIHHNKKQHMMEYDGIRAKNFKNQEPSASVYPWLGKLARCTPLPMAIDTQEPRIKWTLLPVFAVSC